jgi:prepilin-type N-terminal cleavage/methylation domain-containing protein
VKSQKGFSLIEVLIAVALLAIVGGGLLAALTGATNVLIKTDTLESARDLAQAQMEYVQNLAYTDLGPGPSTSPLPDLPQYSNYDSEVILTPIDPSTHDPITTPPDLGLQKVEIKVTDIHSGTLVFTLEGYKADWK